MFLCRQARITNVVRMLAVSREESYPPNIIVDVITIILCTTVTTVTCAGVATTTGPDVIIHHGNGYHGNATNISSSSREAMPDEQRLLVKLLKSYDPGIRPVFNVSQNVVVNFSLTLVQIMDMVKKCSQSVSQSISHVRFQLIFQFFVTVKLFLVSDF